ncbi:unnamed protein product [Victoria cruziana]
MADDAALLDNLLLYREDTPNSETAGWTFLAPEKSVNCLRAGASPACYDQILDPSRQMVGIRSSGDWTPMYGHKDAGSFYNLAVSSSSCCHAGNRSAYWGMGFNLPGSAVHVNCVAEQAPDPQQQMVVELVRRHVLFCMMSRGDPLCRDMYWAGSVPCFHSRGRNPCELSFEKLSISDPASETRGPRRAANGDRAARGLSKRKWCPVRRRRGVLDSSLVKDEGGEQAKKELATITREQHDSMYTSLEEVKGRMVVLAKELRGGQFLQGKCKDGSPEELQSIFMEIKDHVRELTCDGYGNYVVQAFLAACNARQRVQIIFSLTRTKLLFFEMSVHMNGTRVVQQLLKTIKSKEEKSLIRSALKPGVVKLMTDSNGSHVLTDWLELFSHGEENQDIEFIINAAAHHCLQIATDSSGIFVLQNCVKHTKGRLRYLLINEIAENSLHLSQDPLGNYMVQLILGLGIPWVPPKVLYKLKGHFLSLSLQKYSSNVVEECLKASAEKELTQIIRELLESPDFFVLLKGEYGNYVAQSALRASAGYAIHNDLMKSVRANASFLRCPYGKRVLNLTKSMTLHRAAIRRSESKRWSKYC